MGIKPSSEGSVDLGAGRAHLPKEEEEVELTESRQNTIAFPFCNLL